MFDLIYLFLYLFTVVILRKKLNYESLFLKRRNGSQKSKDICCSTTAIDLVGHMTWWKVKEKKYYIKLLITFICLPLQKIDGISSLHPISTLQFISVVKEMKRNHVCPAPLVENMKIFCNEVEELESRIDHMVNQSLICAPHDRRGR